MVKYRIKDSNGITSSRVTGLPIGSGRFLAIRKDGSKYIVDLIKVSIRFGVYESLSGATIAAELADKIMTDGGYSGEDVSDYQSVLNRE